MSRGSKGPFARGMGLRLRAIKVKRQKNDHSTKVAMGRNRPRPLMSATGGKRTLAKDDWEMGVTRPQVPKRLNCISLAALGVDRSRAW